MRRTTLNSICTSLFALESLFVVNNMVNSFDDGILSPSSGEDHTYSPIDGASGHSYSPSQNSHGSGGSSLLNLFRVEGKVVIPKELSHFMPEHWTTGVRILLNYGEYQGFLRDDYSFVINNVPSDSYIAEVANKEFIFEPFRVDVTSKGKIRCRKLNLLQPSAVTTVQYPIKFVAKQPARYFRQREQWRVTDFLFNPMVLMMVVPFLLIMVLPKLVNTSDPEFQREMQHSLQMPKYEWPDMSEYLANLYSGKKCGGPKNKLMKAKKT